jgi:L-alanine-DL-glutamate epimerase-like enolase superfamily enzyme
MIDCYMALTLPYAIELARKCEPYNIKWIEECFLPDDYESYQALKQRVSALCSSASSFSFFLQIFVSIF